MSQLTREQCIEVGLSVPPGPLIGWATEQLAATKGREQRLEKRGLSAPYLKEVKTLIGKVAELHGGLVKKKVSLPPEAAQAQRVRDEALAYWQEAKQIFKIEFGTCPDIQVKCRPGVRTGRLLAPLCRELECVVAVLREHGAQLAWLGVDDAFLAAGELLIGKLKEAQARLESACQDLAPALADACCEMGKLYDLTRKLVRIGQLEYLHEPEQAAAFNYTSLRKELRPGSEVRNKVTRVIAR